jgi:hypothetical protein
MEGYKIYNYERDVLVRQTNEDGSKYSPVEDRYGVWFISKAEHERCGLGMLDEYIKPVIEEETE